MQTCVNNRTNTYFRYLQVINEEVILHRYVHQ